MKRLLIATHNPAKLEELKFGLNELEKLRIKLVSLNDVRVEEEPEETGNTFQENSELKARFYAKLALLPTIVHSDLGVPVSILSFRDLEWLPLLLWQLHRT